MPDIKSIKSKISSTKSLKKITNALEVVSTIKLQKSKKQIDSLKYYINALIDIAHTIQQFDSLFGTVPTKLNNFSQLDIAITTNKGLCGSLNSSLYKYLKQEVGLDNHHLIMIGKKGIERAKKQGFQLQEQFVISDAVLSGEYDPIMKYIIDQIKNKTYDKIMIHFHYFINTLKQKPVSFQLYPYTKQSFEEFAKMIDLPLHTHEYVTNKEILFEPNHDQIIKKLHDMLMNYAIYAAILHSKTGEFAARMLAMKGAKDNATDIISNLTLAYNKARQDAITKEVLEIVSAKSVIEN